MSLCSTLKTLRLSARLTQEDLANKLEVTRFTVANWELGRRIPSIDSIKKVSAIFNINPDTLIGQNVEVDLSADILFSSQIYFEDDKINQKEKDDLFIKFMRLYLQTKE